MEKKIKNNTDLTVEQVKGVAEKRGGNHNPTGAGGFGDVDVSPGDNTRYLRHSLSMWNLPAIDISDAGQVEERIGWYFNKCAEDDMKPSVSGMALALGVDRRTLYDWSRGNFRGVTHSPIVKKAMDLLAAMWEDYMQNGKINPVSGIFLGKNHFGYTDKQEIVVEPKNPLGEAESPEDIKKKYLLDNPESDD